MKQSSEYWKQWFDDRAKHAKSDYILNRGTQIQLDALAARSQKQFLDAVAPKPMDMVLDAGCGSGRNTSLLSPLVKQIVGVDYSDEMLQRARERVANERLANVTLATGDVTNLQYGSNTFDKVICASVLQYIDDADCAKALRELARVCKPEGRLILHIKNGTSLYGLSLQLLRPIARSLGKEMKPEFYRSRRWHEARLRQVGASILDYDGFGILTFVPLPSQVVRLLLNCEMRFPVPKVLKRFAVNYQVTLRVAPAAAG